MSMRFDLHFFAYFRDNYRHPGISFIVLFFPQKKLAQSVIII